MLEGADRGVSGEDIIRGGFFFFQGDVLSRSRARRGVNRKRRRVIRRGRFHKVGREGFAMEDKTRKRGKGKKGFRLSGVFHKGKASWLSHEGAGPVPEKVLALDDPKASAGLEEIVLGHGLCKTSHEDLGPFSLLVPLALPVH